MTPQHATLAVQTACGPAAHGPDPGPSATPPARPPAARRLKLREGWWSSKPAAAPVTVVTGLNPRRLNQLESQCRRWHGPISAAVYVVLRASKAGEPPPESELKELEDAAAAVAAFHKK